MTHIDSHLFRPSCSTPLPAELVPAAPQAGVAADPAAGGFFDRPGTPETLEMAVVTRDVMCLKFVAHGVRPPTHVPRQAPQLNDAATWPLPHLSARSGNGLSPIIKRPG